MSQDLESLVNNRKTTSLDLSRRKIATVLATGSVLPLVGSGQWVRPVVESVVLPAHAETTDATERTVTCTLFNITTNQSITEGGAVGPEDEVRITFTVSPNPGSGFPGTAARTCNGSVATVPNNIATDANGQVIVAVFADAPVCSSVPQQGYQAIFDGITRDCSWTVVFT